MPNIWTFTNILRVNGQRHRLLPNNTATADAIAELSRTPTPQL